MLAGEDAVVGIPPVGNAAVLAASVPAAAGFHPRLVVGLARDRVDQDPGRLVVVGQGGALVYSVDTPGFADELTTDPFSSYDAEVEAWRSVHPTVSRAAGARPGGLDRVVIANEAGETIFYNREPLDLGLGIGFYDTAPRGGPARRAGVVAVQTLRGSYARGLGEVFYVGGSSGSQPDDANVVYGNLVALTAPACGLRSGGAGSGGGRRRPVFVATNAAGLAVLSPVTLDLQQGRAAIRADVAAAGVAPV